MKNCPNLQKSLDWCEGTPQYPGIRRRLYYINKNLIVDWPTLDRDEFGRIIDAHYMGGFRLAADAAWQYIDINIDKSTVTSEPQGEVPSQTQLNKATFVHNGIDAEATAAAGYLNNADCVFVYEDMIGHFRVLGNNKWRTKITVNQDQGQGTNPASTTINIEVTDMIAPPFYVEGLETEDGEVFPSYDDDALLEPRLTSPSGTSFDIGTIADSGSSVSKTMHIKGVNLTEPLTISKTGTGLTVSKSSISVAEAKAGIDITLTYTKSTSGAGSLNGSLRIYSATEVDKTITVTARKAALTSPSASSIDVGTIASDGSSVQTSVTIQGANLSKAVSLRVTGTGFTLSKSSLSASQVNNGTAVIVYYNNTSQGPASATGSLVISSDEVSKTVELTAAKAAPAASPVLTSPTISSLDLGTIASDGTSVNKTVTVRGENVTKPVTITVSGTGFSASVSQITAQQLLAGYGLKLTYTNSGNGPVSATGSVRIQSTEGIDKTISLTAAKAAPAAEPQLVMPTQDAIDMGTIPSDETSVQVYVPIQGRNLTEPLSIDINMKGFSVSPSTISVQQALAGSGVMVTYQNSLEGPATAQATLTIVSNEVHKQVTMTAAKAAPSDTLNDYVHMEDLLLHLDGFVKGETADAWTDLIDDLVFPNHGATAEEKGWDLDGQNDWLGYDASSYNLPFSMENCTIEVCFYDKALNQGTGVPGSTAFLCSFGSQSATGTNQSNGAYVNLCDSNNSKYINGCYLNGGTNVYADPLVDTVAANTLSINKSNALHNGQALSSLGTNHWANVKGGRLIGVQNHGSNGKQNYFNGKIYAIRVYNRILTPAEMLHNQHVDNERFGLGLTLPDEEDDSV